MLSDEEKEIFNNLKDYMQSNIDNGYHKFIYNDLGWDFKCIDCINAIDKVLKQSKEIEELKKPKYVINCKTNEITKLTNDFVSKDKIKEKIEIRKEEKANCKDSIEEKYLLREIYVLQSLLEK